LYSLAVAPAFRRLALFVFLFLVFQRAPFCYLLLAAASEYLRKKEPSPMEWTTPKHEEVDLNCEISSYANAEL